MRLLLLLITFFLVLPFSSVFATVSVPESINLLLPTDGSQYTLKNGSTFETLTINNTNFVFEIAAGGSVELTSGDKKKLTNDMSPAVSTECQTNQSRIFLSVSSGGSTKTVTVTPSGTCTTSSDSSSGGGSPSVGATFGGGGGGGTPPPAPTPAPVTVVSTTTVPSPVTLVPAPAPSPVSVLPIFQGTSSNFNKDLVLGQRTDDVARLQILLASDKSIYPEGVVSGYFGPATLRAVRRFQEKYGISAIGRVGPQTRAKLAEIFGRNISPPAPAPSTSSVPVSISALFAEDMSFGEQGEDISRLQTVLSKDNSIYPEGRVTGYYGPATLRAVKRFQDKYGIPGTGKVGPLTRKKLQELFGGTSVVVPVPSSIPAPSSSVNSEAVQALKDQIKKIQEQILQFQIKQVQEKIDATSGTP